jgi:hypothetical protein
MIPVAPFSLYSFSFSTGLFLVPQVSRAFAHFLTLANTAETHNKVSTL